MYYKKSSLLNRSTINSPSSLNLLLRHTRLWNPFCNFVKKGSVGISVRCLREHVEWSATLCVLWGSTDAVRVQGGWCIVVW